eukprot:m.31551 g.31551  ORF g.31551 m.31551 type:complete len:566 (-) comp16481_c0_seq2:497-2194(-)
MWCIPRSRFALRLQFIVVIVWIGLLQVATGIGNETEVTCEEAIQSVNTTQEICNIVQETEECESEGLVDMVTMVFCQLEGSIAAVLPVMLVLGFALFVGLGVTADAYLCPNLLTLSSSLRLPGHVAGVTLLAFGNGAPDLFSAYAAIQRGPESASLAFGALFGAGMFVCTGCVAAVAFVSQFQFKRRPLFRDVLLFMAAVGWAFYTLTDGVVSLGDAIGYIVLYVLYVVVVIAGHSIYKSKAFKNVDPLSLKMSISEALPLLGHDDDKKPEEENILQPDYSKRFQFLIPIDLEAWKTQGIFSRVIQVFSAPFLWVLQITVPIVHLGDTEKACSWNKIQFVVHAVVSPIVILGIFGGLNIPVGQGNLSHVFLGFGVFGGLLIIVLTKTNEAPRYFKWFSIWGFLASVAVIHVIAEMAVDLLFAAGLVLGVSEAALGILVLGLGNSVGDLVANVMVARHGHPTMAASACFGAPAMNILLGLGGPYLYIIIQNGGESTIFEDTDDQMQLHVAAIFILASLSLILIWCLLQNFVVGELVDVLSCFVAHVCVCVLGVFSFVIACGHSTLT